MSDERIRLTGTEALLAVVTLLLLAVALVRVATPDRPAMRALSLHGLEVASQRVDQNQTVVGETRWDPPDDVYLVGWNPWLGAAGSGGELMLYVGDVRLFLFAEGRTPNQTTYPGGLGYLVRKGEGVVLRYRIQNMGPSGETKGAGALLYFVPAR